MMDQIRSVSGTDATSHDIDDTPDIIVEGSGEAVVQPPRSRGRLFRRIALGIAALLVDPRIDAIHAHSAAAGCFLARIERN